MYLPEHSSNLPDPNVALNPGIGPLTADHVPPRDSFIFLIYPPISRRQWIQHKTPAPRAVPADFGLKIVIMTFFSLGHGSAGGFDKR